MSHIQKDDIYDRQAYGQNLADIARSLSGMTPEGELIANGNRLRVSQPRTFLSTRFSYDAQPLIFSEPVNINGSVTYAADRDGVDLSIGTAQGDRLVRSSNEFFHYQSYRETQFGQGFRFPEAIAGQRSRLGAYFDQDGAFLEQDENGDYHIVRRSNASGTIENDKVAQQDWNVNTFLADDNHIKNPSNVTLDFSKTQMLKMGLLWYGAGYIWIGFQIGQKIYLAHIFQGANVRDLPILGEPTLPLRWEIENLTSVSKSTTFETYGASATSEAGGFADIGLIHGASNRGDLIATNAAGGAFERILTIRPKATFKGKTNRTKIEPTIFGVYAEAEPHIFILARDVPITNSPTWQPVGDESAVEFAVDATGVDVDAGIVKIEDYLNASNKGGAALAVNADTRNPLVVNADGALGDTNLALFALSLGNADAIGAAMQWLEVQ